jgi:O-antigen/teichoic acid export membrane protein
MVIEDVPKLMLYTDKTRSKFLMLPGFRKYFANTSWLIAERIFRSVLLLVVGVYVARYLGPERFGLLSYAMSFVALFSAIAMLGLDGIVVRELVRDGTKRDELLGTVFCLKLAGAFLVLIVLYVAVLFTSNDNFTNLLIFIIALSTVFQSFGVIDFYFQSKVLSKYVVYAQFVSSIVSSLTKLLLIWTGAPLLYFSIVFLLDGLILAIGLAIAYIGQKLNIFDWKFRPKLALRLLKDSWPLVLSGVCISIYMKIDQVMINHMLDTEAVGQYAAAVKLSEGWYFVPMIVCGSLFPAVLNAKRKSDEFYHARLQKLYDLIVWIAIPIALATTLVANLVVQVLYGTQFSKAASVLTIHIWAGVFVSLGVASAKWYIAENLQFFSSINTVIGAIVNIVLNLILIERYGIIGAAWATVISYGLAVYFLNAVYPKTRDNFQRLSRTFNVFRIAQRKRNGIHN